MSNLLKCQNLQSTRDTKLLDSECFHRMCGCRALTCHSSASPRWHPVCYIEKHTDAQFLWVSSSCFLLSVPGSGGRHPPLPPSGIQPLTGWRGSASFPKRREEGRVGGRRWRRGDPRYLQKTQACPSHSPPLNEKAGAGSETDFTTKRRGGNGLDGYFTTPSSAPPFSF